MTAAGGVGVLSAVTGAGGIVVIFGAGGVAAAFSLARKEPSSAMVVMSGAGKTTVVFLSTPISTRLW